MWPWLVGLNHSEVDGPGVCDPETHTHTKIHKTSQMPDLLPSCPNIHTWNLCWRQTSPCVCFLHGCSALWDKQGKSSLSCLVHHRPSHCPGTRGRFSKPSLTSQANLQFELFAYTHAQAYPHEPAQWLQPGSPDAGTHADRRFKERFLSVSFS